MQNTAVLFSTQATGLLEGKAGSPDSPCWAGNARPSACRGESAACLRAKGPRWMFLGVPDVRMQHSDMGQNHQKLRLLDQLLPAGLPGGAGMRPYVVLDGQ